MCKSTLGHLKMYATMADEVPCYIYYGSSDHWMTLVTCDSEKLRTLFVGNVMLEERGGG